MLAKRPYMAALLLLVVGLVFGVTLVTGFGSWKGVSLAFGASDPALGGPLPSLPNDQTLSNMNGSMIAIAKAIEPTIVQVDVKTEAPKASKNQGTNPFQHFFGGGGDNGDGSGGGELPFGFQMPQQGPEEGLGSGVIITADGYILTNNHVVKDAAKKGGVRVKLVDKRVFDARVIGTDPTTDLAVIKIDAANLPVAALGNSDQLSVGQMVLAVGNPLGLSSTVTSGIISSLGRSINLFDAKDAKYGISNFIQTDAAINPGNSGGGLFDIHGAVIGINSAIASQTGGFMGYGFAIPINMAKQVVMDLIKNGKVNRGYIGVTIHAVDATESEALGLDRPRGVRVENVQSGQAGDLAGIKSNDIILSVDGHETDEANQLQSQIAMHHAGDHVTVHLWRDGKEMDKTVTLRPRPDAQDISSNDNGSTDENSAANDNSSSKTTASLDNIGMSVRNLTSSDKDKYGVSNGVVISHVDQASEAWDRGLSANMVVTQVAGVQVKNSADFEKAINGKKGKAVGLTVKDTKGDSHFIALKVPSAD